MGALTRSLNEQPFESASSGLVYDDWWPHSVSQCIITTCHHIAFSVHICMHATQLHQQTLQPLLSSIQKVLSIYRPLQTIGLTTKLCSTQVA